MFHLKQTLGLGLVIVGIASLGVMHSNAQTAPSTELLLPKSKPDVGYVPTPEAVAREMLAVAKVTKDDIVYDLGSGDGRIPIVAAKEYGAIAVGIEINPRLVREAENNARKAGVSDRVMFLEQDLFQSDIKEATVVTLYLLPELNLKLRPILLEQLEPGTRIVSHDFDMGDWKPERVVKTPQGAKIFFWVVPEKARSN